LLFSKVYLNQGDIAKAEEFARKALKAGLSKPFDKEAYDVLRHDK